MASGAAVALLYTPELAARPARLAALQDAQLDALFAAALHSQRLGGDSRIDLLAPYPASLEEFAAQRELLRAWPSRPSATLMRQPAVSGRCSRPMWGRLPPGKSRASPISWCWTARRAKPRRGERRRGLRAGGGRGAGRRAPGAAGGGSARRGAPAAYALADLYEIGMSGIFCSAAQRTEALLRAACLTWIARQEHSDAAAGSWQ